MHVISRGSEFDASWERFLLRGVVASNSRWIAFNFASKRSNNHFNFASKRSNNHFNFASKISHDLLELCVVYRGLDFMMEEPRSWLDRAAITVWSDRNRGVLPRIFSTVRWSFSWVDDHDPPIHCTTIMRRIHRQPSDQWRSWWRSRPSDEATLDEDRASILDRDLDLSAVRCWGESTWSSIARLITRLISFVWLRRDVSSPRHVSHI